MSEWISVLDETPESDYRYLVFIDGQVDYMFFCDDGYWCKDYGLADMSGLVTHWMPLPESPWQES